MEKVKKKYVSTAVTKAQSSYTVLELTLAFCLCLQTEGVKFHMKPSEVLWFYQGQVTYEG